MATTYEQAIAAERAFDAEHRRQSARISDLRNLSDRTKNAWTRDWVKYGEGEYKDEHGTMRRVGVSRVNDNHRRAPTHGPEALGDLPKRLKSHDRKAASMRRRLESTPWLRDDTNQRRAVRGEYSRYVDQYYERRAGKRHMDKIRNPKGVWRKYARGTRVPGDETTTPGRGFRPMDIDEAKGRWVVHHSPRSRDFENRDRGKWFAPKLLQGPRRVVSGVTPWPRYGRPKHDWQRLGKSMDVEGYVSKSDMSELRRLERMGPYAAAMNSARSRDGDSAYDALRSSHAALTPAQRKRVRRRARATLKGVDPFAKADKRRRLGEGSVFEAGGKPYRVVDRTHSPGRRVAYLTASTLNGSPTVLPVRESAAHRVGFGRNRVKPTRSMNADARGAGLYVRRTSPSERRADLEGRRVASGTLGAMGGIVAGGAAGALATRSGRGAGLVIPAAALAGGAFGGAGGYAASRRWSKPDTHALYYARGKKTVY